jgi:hypothetical protein
MIAATILVVSSSAWSVQRSYTQAKVNDWRALARYIQASVRPGDIIVGSVWFRQALDWYFADPNAVLLNDDQQAARDYALAGDRVWYVLLETIGGTYSSELQQHLGNVDDAAWMPPDLAYRDLSLFFPVSEVPIHLFSGGQPYVQARHFYDSPEPNWTDRSYRQLAPGEALHVELGLETPGERLLSVTYFDAPGHALQVRVANQTLDLPIDNQFAWRTTQIPLQGYSATIVPITITSVGKEVTGVSDVALDPLLR